jgi:poly-gamma-glutamate capsule biosynthesis protein CapA/YwtB (metallophosphatase superfamily)
MTAILHAVGDVAPDREDPAECFALAADTLRAADIGFCQLECNLTTRGVRMPQARHTHRGPVSSAHAMKQAGIDVVSFASNHCMDWGPDGLSDTIANLTAADIDVVGVGPDISVARRPVVREVNGVRVAILAYSSILPEAYWATESRPGCAPLRAHTLYEQIETDQPGTPARIRTFAFRNDLAAMVADIQAAKTRADVVILSLHWGIHFVPAVLAEYQREVARAAVDAGASLILGHHAHILKGIEFYKGRAIFYSLSNFAVDLKMTAEHAASKGFREIQALSPDWEPNLDSLYNFPPDSRMSIIVRAALEKDGSCELSLLPVFINDNAQPETQSAGDERFTRVVDYLRWCCSEEALNAEFSVDGDRVHVQPEGVISDRA